jgi:uncharacterized protein YuzE
MRTAIVCLVGIVLIAACSKPASDSGKRAAPAPAPTAAPAPATPAAPAVTGPAVSGIYTANGKPAALAFVSAHPDEPFSGQPVTELVFTSQDQGGVAKPGFDASFGKLGDAIVIKVHPDGSIIGAEIVHAGLKRQGAISTIGTMSVKDYRVAGGEISGHLTSGGPADVFDEKVDVDLTFHTKAP